MIACDDASRHRRAHQERTEGLGQSIGKAGSQCHRGDSDDQPGIGQDTPVTTDPNLQAGRQ